MNNIIKNSLLNLMPGFFLPKNAISLSLSLQQEYCPIQPPSFAPQGADG